MVLASLVDQCCRQARANVVHTQKAVRRHRAKPGHASAVRARRPPVSIIVASGAVTWVHGHAEQVHAARRLVLDAAYATS
jgi:hypothetical protein